MFCRQCGSEIPNEAKFCTFCGAKTVAPKSQTDEVSNTSEVNESIDAQNAAEIDQEAETAPLLKDSQAETNSNTAEESTDIGETQDASTESIQTDASDATASSETNNLKAAVAQNKKRSRRRMPMILLVALALALATSVAYAAYRVYTDVWLPYQAEQEMQAKHPLKDADGDTVTSEVSGEPKNALQIADLMMMDPASIPDFLDEQGLNYDSVYGDGRWSINRFSYLDNEYQGSFDNSLFNTIGETSLYVGDDTSIVSPHSLGSVASKRMLKSGTEPAGIMVGNLPIRFGSTDDEISKFCEEANLGKPLEKFSSSGMPLRGGSAQSYKTWVYTGVASAKADEKILWYISANNEDNQVLFGCLKLDKAYELVSSYGLYTEDQWNSANNREKAKIAAQSLSQEYWLNLEGYRINVLTKKVEFENWNDASWKEGRSDKGGFVSPWDGTVVFDSDISNCFADTFQSETTDL